MSDETSYHQPVLLHECIEYLDIRPDGTYIDATFGGGGHSREMLKKLGPKGRLMIFDQDEDALRNLPEDNRVIFIRENFRYAARFVRLHHLKLHGLLADLGVSSHQFDTAERGFSTRFDARLDMRMDRRSQKTAQMILNQYDERKLEQLFEEYGEVTNAKAVAKKIADIRKRMQINTINEFKQAIDGLVYGNPQKYLAQVFQALRIETNDELNALKQLLTTITPCLEKGGRLAFITFHSLEDRIVKQWFKQESFDEDPFSITGSRPVRMLKTVTKKPVLPSEEECARNPRARSSKLRVAEKT